MKLFQRMLVAPAALGLLAPIAANATEVNLNEISNYSDIESIEFANSFNDEELTETDLLAGGEGLVEGDSFDSNGGFSGTTTASFSSDFLIGAVQGKGITSTVTDGDETLQAGYSFQIDLNTSFTGEDSLDVSIDAGNTVSGSPLDEFDPNQTADKLTVDGVSYTFPLGEKLTVFVGDNTDGSALFTTACVYGGASNTLDDCANINAGITGGETTVGAAYDIGNGFTAAFGYQTTPTGVGTDGSLDAYGVNVAYTADSYGVSLTYSMNETGTNGIDDDTYTALNAYWTPDGFPSISAGLELGSLGGEGSDSDSTRAYFVGVEFDEVGPGALGFAVGTNGSMTETSGVINEEFMYEAYYSYPLNDGMTITPLVYIQEDDTAGEPDRTGIMLKTSFSF